MLDPGDLLGPRPGLLARRCGVGVGAAGPLRSSGQPRLHLGRLDLPPHALLARRFLLCFEVGQTGALGTELFGGARALDLPLLQLDVQRTEARFDFREPLG